MSNILEKNFTDGRKITSLIVERDEETFGLGFKNVIEKEGELQEGVVIYLPKSVIPDLIKLLNKYV